VAVTAQPSPAYGRASVCPACLLQCYNVQLQAEYTGKSKMSQHVLAAVDDIFFASKIRATAEHLGLDVRFHRTTHELIARAREDHPSLIIVDLHTERCDPIALARCLKDDESLRSIPLLGFFSHVQIALRHSAEAAGFDRVMPRSTFTTHLSEILQNTQAVEP
jgi:CheY-like chemotaxis protein